MNRDAALVDWLSFRTASAPGHARAIGGGGSIFWWLAEEISPDTYVSSWVLRSIRKLTAGRCADLVLGPVRLLYRWLGPGAGIVAVAVLAFTVHAAQRPNVVVLLADDLGWGDIGLHGGDVPTPHIDRLFRQGVEIDTFLVHSVCSPTRAAFLTGRHPARVGVNPQVVNARVGERMNPQETTLAEVFQSAGYKAAILGKWHLGYAPSDPNSKGFELFYGFLGAATYLERTDDAHTRWMLNDKPAPEPGYSTDLIRERAVRYIAKTARGLSSCMWRLMQSTTQCSRRRTTSTACRPRSLIRMPARGPRWSSRSRDAVGAVVNRIDEQGLGERTIVVFFSDNGPMSDGRPGPFRGRKHTIWEGGVRSPTAIRWKGRFQPGAVSRAMLAAPDLFPTLLTLAGVPIPGDLLLDGLDFSDCLIAARGILLGLDGLRRHPYRASQTGSLRRPEGALRFARRHRRDARRDKRAAASCR